jgi:SAM-dependent methyltransferase
MSSIPSASSEPSNREQIEFWNGTAAERWVREQDGMDRALGPFGLAAMERLAPAAGEGIVDVGCGSGHTLLQLAERVGSGGRVLGVDPSRPLLERARERTRHLRQVELCEGDAASLSLPGPLHGLFSRFGVMFFADPAQAFSSLRAQLEPGARLSFVCWQPLADNAWSAVPLSVACSVLGEAPVPPDPTAPGPFAFASPVRVNGVLRDAGWHHVEIEAFRTSVLMSSEGAESAVNFMVQLGPVSRLLAQRSEEQRTAVRQRLTEHFQPSLRDGRLELEGAAWLVSARA